jgi:hypothetical protein
MKRIEITIATDGKSKVETHGFTGDACRDASRFLETALGKSTNETLKPEFHQVSTTNHQKASE